ncbi:hypothetical protein X566_20255 [Afipia sp. P52-10]|uniref:hypothetical protein n=1 Tax=Afipia sp. P52-10 TaxID=1429916 RepID=UPI0003DF2E6B|nr:hypothetical protein [Afipia sp. P52-10]ETR75927.1 hypothetical protein X566_20255 [Afipia sp. P52-10]
MADHEENQQLLRTEGFQVHFGLAEGPAGHVIQIAGGLLPSCQDMTFGLLLRPETTSAEAAELRRLLEKHADTFFARYFDRPPDGVHLYDHDRETDLAIVGDVEPATLVYG